MLQSIRFARAKVVLAVAASAAIVNAGIVKERQNPGFITTLPTVGPTVPFTRSPVAPITTTVAATNLPPLITTTANSPLQTIPPPSSALPPSDSATPILTVNELQGPFFGGIPDKTVDIPLTSTFLILFLLGGIINATIYRSKLGLCKRTLKDPISGLVGLFCLARVVSCLLRNIWAISLTSNVAIFLALVSENAGTTLLFFLNFYLAKRMVGFFKIQMSLWAKTTIKSVSRNSVIAYLALVFLLNSGGVALFEFNTSNSDSASTASSLVEASACLLFILNLILLGAVLLVSLSVEKPDTPRLGAKTAVFFIGAGLFTITQLVRMASSFYIWRITNDAGSEAILSKPSYYATGMGFEILIIVLYASTRIDLLFAAAPSLTSLKTPEPNTVESFKSFSGNPLRMNSVVIKGTHSGSVPLAEYSVSEGSSTPVDRDSISSSQGIGNEGPNQNGEDELRNGMFISIQRTFSISSQKLPAVPHNDKSRR